MDAERLPGLGVAQPDHVHGHEHLPHRLGQRRHALEHQVGLGRLLGLDVGPRRRRLKVVKLRGDLRTARGRAPRVEVGVAQRPVQLAEIVLTAHEARSAQHPLIGLLDEVLGVLAGAAQCPRRPKEPVEVVAERLWVEGPRHGVSMIARPLGRNPDLPGSLMGMATPDWKDST
jgi:hypothetical protein